MAKAKRSGLWTLFKVLIIIVAIVVALLIGLYLVLRFAIGIDIFAIRKQVNLLSVLPDEATYISVPYSNTDLSSAKTKFTNAGLESLFDDGDFSALIKALQQDSPEASLNSSIQLTDKELGAILGNVIQTSLASSLESSAENIGIQLLQVKFLDITKGATQLYNKTSCNMEVIVKLNISTIAAPLRKFPLSIVTKKLPNYIYAKATFSITNTQDNFGYTVEPTTLILNNLTSDQTAKTFAVLKTLNIGDPSSVCNSIAEIFASIAIGTSSSDGFASYLRYVGANDYSFETIEGTKYFVINKA